MRTVILFLNMVYVVDLEEESIDPAIQHKQNGYVSFDELLYNGFDGFDGLLMNDNAFSVALGCYP